MKKEGRKFVLAALILAVTLLPAALYAGHHPNGEEADSHSSGKVTHSENPLIDEMIKLDGVFREVVSGVAMGDGPRVYEALEAMHGTMEKTHEGVNSGKVTIKKNADRLKEFVKMDKDFHETLETLAHAAHDGDHDRMLNITKTLLDGCVECHRSFR